MSEARPILGIVLGHGDMPTGLVNAVRHIAGGSADSLVPISNEDRAPDALVAALEAVAGDEPAIVFTDLPSGSCGVAAAYSCRDRSRRAVICGVNLPMLLDFVFHRDMPLEPLVERLLDKGRGAIRAVPTGG